MTDAPTSAAPVLRRSDLARASDFADAARQARSLTFMDARGRRIKLELSAPSMPGGGYWNASYTDSKTGRTVNAYVGTHRANPTVGMPAVITPEGLALASDLIAGALARQS